MAQSEVVVKTVENVQAALPLAEPRARIESIDFLRGLVILIMALDHTRVFFYSGSGDFHDVTQYAFFATRWITNFCAPVFILLAGVSAYLYGASGGRNIKDLRRFLVTRGLWLIFLEFTIVSFCWTFGVNLFIAQVIWAIGVSMIFLAAIASLPRKAIAIIGLAMIAGHNLFDGVQAASFGGAGWIWNFLHKPAFFYFGENNSISFLALYPLIPWVGVMAAGYALGPVFKLETAARKRFLLKLGAAVTLGFIALRATNLYGNPTAWAMQDTWLSTVLSFIDCEKYPPSLLFIMMTLGPALLALVLLEKLKGRLANVIINFGRVPFLVYIAHIPFIHALSVLLTLFRGEHSELVFGVSVLLAKPEGFGTGLVGIYVIWVFVVLALYPLCHWFANLKRRRRDWWLSYL